MKKTLILMVVILCLTVTLLTLTAGELDTKDTKIDNSGQEIQYTAEQDYFFAIFKNRRSVRKFKSTPVPDEHIMKILDIARSAPTSGNQQPWKFLVIRNREKLNQLKEDIIASGVERAKKRGITDAEKINSLKERYGKSLEGYLSAPVFIAVLTDNKSKYPSYNIHDGPLAAGYLIIAARALGYGTVYVTDSFPFGNIKKVFEIPDNYTGVCFIPLGVPETWPESKPKKPLEDFVAFETLEKK
jgi:nitroreductase